MNKWQKKLKLFFILIVVIATVSSYFCFVHYTFQIKECFDQCVENEDEIIEVSKTLLKDPAFSQEGMYSIYIDDYRLKVDSLDWFDETKGDVNCSARYMELFDKMWMNKDAKIEINVFAPFEKGAASSVTYKFSFFSGKTIIWIYYGDFSAFPSCPDSSARRDNIKKLTDNLYYAEHLDWF